MSEPSRDTHADPVDVDGSESAEALRTLARALERLGDDASRAAETSRDVRLHVVACQAQHLACEVGSLQVAAEHVARPSGDPGDVAAAVAAVTKALIGPGVPPLPEGLAASLGWLLQLADAVTP